MKGTGNIKNKKFKDKLIFENTELNIKKGLNILLGENGSGKSTLLRLLTGTFTNFSGAIRINNIALGSYSIDSLRSSTGVLISQQDIFQGTVRDNITMGDKAVESNTLFEISKKTGLDNFISGLEMGFDSIIDPAGKKLPEKIKQGILLARALLNKKQLFLLENPFDGLSTETIEETKQTILGIQESTILINNAIHPGEPDGVNAMLIWIDTWIKNGKNTSDIPLIAFIPAYNVGGMMNRSSTSRANQNGPEEYGFRGNAKNLDLNRDFIKMDSQNAFTFAKIFHALDPDVFIDMHVSNGADYQYTLTYISSMKERMAPEIRNLCYSELLPYLRKSLKSKKIDLFPYVELKGETPAQGIYAFNDLPRYAMGYASLFNSLSFTVETHMLKPFPERVQASLAFMEEVFKWTFENQIKIELSRKSAFKYFETQDYFKFNYKLTEKPDSILFCRIRMLQH